MVQGTGLLPGPQAPSSNELSPAHSGEWQGGTAPLLEAGGALSGSYKWVSYPRAHSLSLLLALNVGLPLCHLPFYLTALQGRGLQVSLATVTPCRAAGRPSTSICCVNNGLPPACPVCQ